MMGLFDNVKCDYSLPWPEAAEFGFEWQTKSTDDPDLDVYEIRADGTLWREKYELRIEEDDKAPFGFWQHRHNRRWEQVNWTGEFEIHHYVGDEWYSVIFWFQEGMIADSVPQKSKIRDTKVAGADADG